MSFFELLFRPFIWLLTGSWNKAFYVMYREQHKREGLISFETHQRILDIIEGKKRRPAARKDFNEDFPLRGNSHCECCGNAMTAAWSKGKYKHYPYYFWITRVCEMKGKTVPRAKVEDGFLDILKTLQPATELFELANAMLKDAWDMRLAEAKASQAALGKEIKMLKGRLRSFWSDYSTFPIQQ